MVNLNEFHPKMHFCAIHVSKNHLLYNKRVSTKIAVLFCTVIIDFMTTQKA